MTEAVIVSTARTPIGKAYRGALNNTEGPTMAGHVIGEAVRRAKVEPGERSSAPCPHNCGPSQS
jgi:acetyl-CoA C-acetyltransferase